MNGVKHKSRNTVHVEGALELLSAEIIFFTDGHITYPRQWQQNCSGKAAFPVGSLLPLESHTRSQGSTKHHWNTKHLLLLHCAGWVAFHSPLESSKAKTCPRSHAETVPHLRQAWTPRVRRTPSEPLSLHLQQNLMPEPCVLSPVLAPCPALQARA